MRSNLKKYLIVLLVLLSICAIPIIATATSVITDAQISAEAEKTDNGIKVKLKSDIEIKYIKMYRKTTSGTYILFYKSIEDNIKEKEFYFSRNILPETVDIRIVVVDINDVESTGDLPTIEVPPMPSINPEETEKPSWSPSTLPTKPTPSTSVAPSTSASTAPTTSSAPTTSPSPSDDSGDEKITYNGKKYTVPKGDKVYFFDVADYNKSAGKVQGSDCMLVCSNGKYGLIDATLSSKADRVVKHLKELGVDELEFIIVSHNHGDHVGGYSKIAKKIKIKKMYVKKNYSVARDAKKMGTEIIYGGKVGSFEFENFKFKFYCTKDVGKSGRNENINCLTALCTHKPSGKKIYFAGDIQNQKSADLYPEVKAAKAVGKVNVYKVAHHCYNAENNDQRAINALKPNSAVATNRKGRGGTETSAKRIQAYTGSKKFYWAGNGTVLLNLKSTGDISFKQFPEEK